MLGHAAFAETPISVTMEATPSNRVGVPLSMSLVRRRFARQPGQAVLDKGHPLSRGLVFAAYHSQQEAPQPPRNLVTGAMGSHVNGTTTLMVDAKGLGRTWGGAAGSKVFAPLGGLTRVSFAFDLYWPTYNNVDAVCLDSETWTTGETFLMNPNAGNGGWVWEYRHTNGQRCVAYFTRPTGGWHSYVLEYDTTLTSGQACAAYVDGVLQSHLYFSNGIGAAGQFRDMNLLFFYHDGPSSVGGGSMRNLKIYNRLLTQLEAVSLAKNPYQNLLPPPTDIVVPGVITAAIASRRPAFINQPQGPVEIDWGHPITRGLVSSLFNSATDALRTYDYVTRTIGTRESGGTIMTNGGIVVHSPNGSNVAGRQIKAPSLTTCRFLTLSWWEWIDSNTNVHFGYNYISANGLMINPASGTGRTEFWISDSANNGGSTRASIRGITRPSNGAWHFFVWLLDLDDNVNKGYTGVKVDMVTQTLTPNGFYGDITAPVRLSAGSLFNFNNQTISGASSVGNSRWRNFNVHNRQLTEREQWALFKNPWQILKPIGRQVASVNVSANVEFNFDGMGGTITAATIPVVGAVVRLYNETTGALLLSTTTDALGNYVFGSIAVPLNPALTYTIIAYDALTGYQYNGGILRGMVTGKMIP